MKVLAAKVCIVGALLFLLCPTLAADTHYTRGIALYKAKNYRAAAAQFEEQLKIGKPDVNCLYYCALSQQMSNNRARARQLYEYVSRNFPNSSVAQSSALALTQLSALGRSSSAGISADLGESATSTSSSLSPSSSSSSSLSRVPEEVRVPFEKKGLHAYVEVLFNNRPLSMIFDTGAEITAVGLNHLEDLGLARPETRETMILTGVGDNTRIHAWVEKFDLKLGPIYRRDFPVTVQPDMPTAPLLGQTFFKDFDVTMDDSSKQFILRKKFGTAARDARKGRAGAKAVPFVRGGGGSMYVDALVNGKPYKMVFDTGAHGTLFTLGDFAKMGLTVPPDADEGQVRGVGGSSRAWSMYLRSLQIGPLRGENVPISVSDSQDVGHPLLGQTFFGRFKYEIDNEKSMIYFYEQ